MIAKTYSAVLTGLEPQIIEVETGLLKGISSFSIVGLANKAIDESKERLTLALRSIKAKPPLKFNAKTIVNLAPSDVKKEGALLDLAIALSFLSASEQTKSPPDKILFLGELGLDGNLRKVTGVLPIILGALKLGFKKFFIPAENQFEVRFLKEGGIYIFNNLQEVIETLEGQRLPSPLQAEEFQPAPQEVDFSFLKLPAGIIQVIKIAASGRHNLLLYGPPGTGKTLIGKALAHLLPPLTYGEALEITGIYSSCGELKPASANASARQGEDFISYPPFRQPHHTASPVSILGGGQNPKAGEVSLAHRGVLFFDELPEFRRDVLEGLREPLENKEITIARAKKRICLPANFLFIGAYNPCPCGFYQDPEKDCSCSTADIRRYRKKVSGPIRDRLDLFLYVPRIAGEKIFQESEFDLSGLTAEIAQLKDLQFARQGKYNGELSPKELKTYCTLTPEAEKTLIASTDTHRLSLRGIHKIMRVARTIADLKSDEIIQEPYVSEAVQYRFWQEE